jgi:hypothetical protein
MTPIASRPASLQGSLGELALPDVLQLLDLGRKTGVLVVRRTDPATDGAIVLVEGRVMGAAVREPGSAEPHAALVARALRHAAPVTEAAVYEVLGWREGRFSFAPLDAVVDAALPAAGPGGGVSVDALLMEAARRDDEWARLASRVPHLGLVPTLADVGDAGLPLDLAPEAWALLAAVDGERDLRAVAAALATDPLAVARTADVLAAAGVLSLVDPCSDVPTDGARSSSR